MNESHKKVCEQLFEISKEILKETGRVSPAFFVITKDQIILLSLPPQLNLIVDDLEYQQACFKVANQVCEQMKGEALVHISEAWTLDGTKEDMSKHKGKVSESPNRQESVILTYISSFGERLMYTGKIIHLADSNERILQNAEWLSITSLPISGDINKPGNEMIH